MRLTKEIKDDYYAGYYTNGQMSSGIVYINDNKDFTNAAIYKLGEYEDTEEELNVNLKLLPTLLKIKEGDKIYVIDGTLVEAEVTGNSLINGKLMVFSHYGYNGITYTPVCYYSEYGKTWALTKEELEQWKHMKKQ